MVGIRRAAALQGMGGVGKTVLAAALVLDEQIRRAFPDGISWLTLGQTPDLFDLQRRLLARVDPSALAPATLKDGREALDSTLKRRRWLIVLDDIWALAHYQAFDIADTPSRILFTTRDESIVRVTGATSHVVEELTWPAARDFLAKAVGLDPSELPPERSDVIRRCGRLPLALALAGATLAMAPRDPALWREVVGVLQEADHEQLAAEFGYPYPHVIAAIQASVDFLPSEERAAYLQLAIFPEDEPIPPAPLGKLWHLSTLALRRRINLFIDRALARREEDGSMRLHDLQRDFTRRRCADLAAAHAALLDGYRSKPGMLWANVTEDGYLYRHLPRHLAGAGRLDELRKLLLSAPWLTTRLRAVGTGGVCDAYDLLASDSTMRVVAGALRLSLHVLEKEPEQLASQLAGRLGQAPNAEIGRLLADAAAEAKRPCLLPRAPSLTPPGSQLHQTLVGHQKGVAAVAVTPDGRAVSASEDHTLKIWDLAAGTCIATLVGHADAIYGVAVTADGRAVSASIDGTLKVWDLTTGSCTATLLGHAGPVLAVAVTADGQAISASDDQTLKVWDVASGTCTTTFTGHDGKGLGIAVTADGRAISTSMDGTIKVWDLKTGACTQTFAGHGRAIAIAAIDEGQFVSGSFDGTLEVCDLASGRCTATLTGHRNFVWGVAVTADGRAVSASADWTLKVWDLASGVCTATLVGHSAWVRAVAVTAEGRAVSASDDHTLKVWDLQTGSCNDALAGHAGAVNAVALTAGGRGVSTSRDRTLKVWDLKTGMCTATLVGHDDEVNSLAVTADGRAVSASDDRTLKVWDLETGACAATLTGHDGDVLGVAVTADGRAVSASNDRTLKVWDLTTGSCMATLVGHAGPVHAVAVTVDGRAVSASDDRTLKVWDLKTGICMATLVGHEDAVFAVAVTADGRAVSASYEPALKVWDLASGACILTLTGHESWVSRVAVTTDGRAVSAADDLTLKVWDLGSGTCLTTLSGHEGDIFALDVTSNGRVVSASGDRTLRVWDCGTGACLASYHADADVFAIACTEDGLILAGDASGGVHILKLLEDGSAST